QHATSRKTASPDLDPLYAIMPRHRDPPARCPWNLPQSLKTIRHYTIEEAGGFAFNEVAKAIADKMVRRHPHVFGEAEIATAAAQTLAWEEQKAAERS